MTNEEYFASDGLSNSSMKDLEVSPLRYWWHHINPLRTPKEPTRAMVIGSALHCAVLERDQFNARYACEFDAPDDCLDTMDQLRKFLVDRGVKPLGTRKADVIAQIQQWYPNAPILDVLESEHAVIHAGKEFLSHDEFDRVNGMANTLREESKLREILSIGKSEVALFGTDPETGVSLKAKLDFRGPRHILDLKTFTQMRGKSIDKSIHDAIYYEKYYRQAWFYSRVDSMQPDSEMRKPREFVMAFVESEEPFEVRLKVLRPTTTGSPNLYWMTAANEANALIRRYADSRARFGNEPWRDECAIELLLDEDVRQFAFV